MTRHLGSQKLALGHYKGSTHFSRIQLWTTAGIQGVPDSHEPQMNSPALELQPPFLLSSPWGRWDPGVLSPLPQACSHSWSRICCEHTTSGTQPPAGAQYFQRNKKEHSEGIRGSCRGKNSPSSSSPHAWLPWAPASHTWVLGLVGEDLCRQPLGVQQLGEAAHHGINQVWVEDAAELDVHTGPLLSKLLRASPGPRVPIGRP